MSRYPIRALLGAAMLVLAMFAAPRPALADRAHDTLNVVEALPLGAIDMYYGTYPHTQFMSNMLFDSLVDYDPVSKSIVPLIATSWKLIGNDTIEFRLRTDMKWHDGKPLTADDVVYTFNWLIDPSSRYFMKFRWDWIKSVKKTAPDTVQLVTAPRRPYDLLLLTLAPIYPQHVRAALSDPMQFGRKPVGSGPYKVQEYNEQQNRLVVVRNPDYPINGPTKHPATFGKVVMRTISDQGAQISALMVGEADLIRNLPADQAESLTSDPRFGLTVNPNIGVTFMWFDTVGKGGNEALLNPKVRQALMLAVNRKNLEKLVNGTQVLAMPENLCWKDRVLGCDYTVKAPAYDPAKAEALLAEAGFPNGFPLRITSYVGRLSLLAEAVAGDLAKIGVKVSVEPVTVGTFTKKAQAGQIQATVAGNSLGGLPDVSQLYDYFFEAYNMTNDPEIPKLGKQLDEEQDPGKRKKLTAQLFDRVQQRFYILPLTSQPHFFTHTKELVLAKDSANSYGIDISRMHWKDQK